MYRSIPKTKALHWPIFILIASTISGLFLFSCTPSDSSQAHSESDYVTAPFDSLDTYATNDWWNREPNKIIAMDVARDSVIAFGTYTVANQRLKLSAQLFPLYPEESRTVYLDIKKEGDWEQIQQQEVNEIGWSALFRVNDWPEHEDIPYRLRHGEEAIFEGTIRKLPTGKEEITIAALSCNSSKDVGPRTSYVNNINALDPDLVFFAGDQSYFHTEHTAGWLLFGMQFRDAFRHRPMIAIPDDHDVGQGNIWGEGGKKASSPAGSDGGYFYHHEYVKMVERCQTAHLPDPVDPEPIQQGIGVYFTSLQLGPVDFAIIEDRKFKSGPEGKIPQQGPRPDHIRDPNYDPQSVNVEGLALLGDRQLAFLENWGEAEKAGVQMRAVLSQTGFCGAAHIHGKLDNRLHADMDSNGWPQDGRDRALELIRAAQAVHIGGDQHLATVIKHGIEEYRDGPWAFVVPAVVNNYYSRWWWPLDEKAGENPVSDSPLPWTGDYKDGFDNKISMFAYANPDNTDNGAGFGFIRFRAATNEVVFECYPRTVNLAEGESDQFPGWPITVKL